MRDERIRVDIFHQPEDLHRLTLVGKHDKHFHIVLAVPSRAIQYGHSAMCLFRDPIRNLFILFGEDKELHGLAGAVHNVIEYEADDKERHKTEDHTAPIIEDEIAGGDDKDIAKHDHTA